MESNIQPDGSARMATAGGTLLVMLLQVSGKELIKTSVLAAIGAIVSFGVSLALKWLIKRIRIRKK
jgi:hypothetical protein